MRIVDAKARSTLPTTSSGMINTWLIAPLAGSVSLLAGGLVPQRRMAEVDIQLQPGRELPFLGRLLGQVLEDAGPRPRKGSNTGNNNPQTRMPMAPNRKKLNPVPNKRQQ